MKNLRDEQISRQNGESVNPAKFVARFFSREFEGNRLSRVGRAMRNVRRESHKTEIDRARRTAILSKQRFYPECVASRRLS